MEFIKRKLGEVSQRWKNFCFPRDTHAPSDFFASRCEGMKAEAPIEQSDDVGADVPENGNVNASTNSSEEALQRQGNRALCLLRNLQLLFPANTSTDTRPPNQEKPIAPEVPSLNVDLESNQSIIPDHDVNKLNVEGSTADEVASTSTTCVNPNTAGVELGKNRFSQSSAEDFRTSVCEALEGTSIIMLAACALVSLVVGLLKEGWPKDVYYYNGLGLNLLVASVLLAVFVTRSYRQNALVLKYLDREKQRIARDACSQKISTNDVLPERIFHLKAGDKVPADGIFISWSSEVKNNPESPNLLANCNGAAATMATSQAGSSSSRDSASEDLPTTSSLNSNDLIRVLVANLESPSIEDKKQAARLIRILTKDNPENQVKIAKAGAIKSLISLLFSSDTELQEDGVTSILNLSLCEENKELKMSPKAIKPLIRVLDNGTLRAKVKAASILLLLSQGEDDHHCKTSMGWLGAIPLLVRLLEGRCTNQGKMKAAKALQSLCSVQDNKRRAVKAGIMRPLVKFMVNLDIDMAEVSVDVLSVLVSLPVAIEALVEQQGIPALVKMIEEGWRDLKEIAVVILLRICEDDEACCAMVANQRESVIRGLENRSRFNSRTRQKTLIELIISNPRFEDTTA